VKFFYAVFSKNIAKMVPHKDALGNDEHKRSVSEIAILQ